MARPREFDEEAVLDSVISTFWSRGFEATSIQDLVEATSLSRASLYGAFGDKETLYARAIERYVAQQAEHAQRVEQDESALHALEVLIGDWVKGVCGKDAPRGCFLQLAGSEKDTDSWIRDVVRDQQNALEALIVRLIKRGQKLGEIARAIDAEATAKMFVVLQQGLASAGRIGWSRERMNGAARQALDLLHARR